MLWAETVLPGEAALHRITTRGLTAIGSQLEPPPLDLGNLRRDLAAVWTWVAAWDGAFGPLSRVMSRRESSSLDLRAVKSGASPSGFGLRIREGVRFPDLALVTNHGHRMAVELLLWPGRAFDVDELCAGHREQLALDAVLVLVDNESARRKMTEAAGRAGISDRVFVRGAQTGARGLPGA
jgi:hypothetical protein